MQPPDVCTDVRLQRNWDAFVHCFMSGLNPINIERMRQSVMIVQFLLG